MTTTGSNWKAYTAHGCVIYSRAASSSVFAVYEVIDTRNFSATEMLPDDLIETEKESGSCALSPYRTRLIYGGEK